MNKQSKKPRSDALYQAILKLKTVERYQVASYLEQGMIYNEILEKTGASSATISRVNRSLQYGKGGYAVVFERLEQQKEQA